MANNPTVVIGSLNDEELKKSIDKLVNHVDEQLNYMVSSTKVAVMSMNKSLKSLGDTKIDFGGSADGGASKRAKAQNAETSALEKSNQAAKEKIMTLDQEQAVIQKTIDAQNKLFYARTMKIPTDQYDMQIAKLERIQAMLERYRKGEMSFSPSQVSGLEKEERTLLHLLGQVNTAQQQTTQSAQRYTEEIRKQAQAIRESKQWKETGTYSYQIGDATYYVSKKQGEIEAQLVRHKEQQVNYQKDYLTAGMAVEQSTKQQASTEEKLVQAEQQRLGIEQQITQEKEKQKKKYTSPTSNEWVYNQSLYNNFIKSRLGGKTPVSWKENTSDINTLNAALSQLRKVYSSLTSEERAHPYGQSTLEQIQRLERRLNVLRSEMSRPLSLNAAMGLSEKTLDDIAYKMRQLSAYRSGLDVSKQSKEIAQVNDEYNRLKKRMDEVMQKNQQMIASNTALGRSWNYMKNRLAFYFTVGASTQFVKQLIDIRGQYELLDRSIGILIDSAQNGSQIFAELNAMAIKSPFTTMELGAAAKQLVAYDVAAKDVVDTTRRLADMAAAVGIPIERLTYALGQIKAYGYLNSRDARMFANAGIPLVKQLSDYYTQLEGRLVSTADVYDRIKKKTIDYEQVVQVINKMTDEGGKFFDFQAKMADTLKVRLANLTLAWNNMLNDMGSSNQGVLTTGIGLLRDMFLHWKDLESAIGKVAAAFGIYKAAQLVTLIWTGRITTAMGVQELVGKKLQARFASLTIAQKGFVSAATAGWAALAFIVADAWLTISRNMEEIEQLNKSIADGAKESYEAIDKMLHSSEMVSTRLSAAQGKLSDTDAAKAWEMLREQIELSAASSKELIAELLKEPDINKRVTESFNLAEKIEEANRKLSDLNDSLDVSQNSILGGLFGEGLAEDIDDYNARIKYTSDVAEWASKKNKGFWENAAMGLRALFNEVKDSFGSDANEAQEEIKNFAQKAAQTIKDELGEEGIKDKIQVNEAIARVVRGMEQQFPQIRGKGKVLFETIFYDTMAKEFKGAVDGQAYYYEQFLEQLKKDHASAFSAVTEDIKKETFKWSSAQIDAIQKTADKVKKDLPAASQGAIDEILRQLNSTDFKVRIVAEMATTSLDNVQKQFRERFIEKPWIADDKEREKEENEANQRYGTLMRKNTETNVEYEKRISDEKKTQLELSQKNADIISKNQGKEDEYSKAVLADAKKQKEIADDRLKAINEIENKGGYDFSTKSENAAARKAAKQAETELQKALKDELSTIEKVRSIYKDLTKEGMSHANAVERATRGWGETVNAINRVLQKNGLQKLDLSKFAGIENPRELVNMLQSQLNTLLKRGAKPAEINELQTKVNTLEVDADKYDLTKITKGLNNELGKLKDEYELAVELDANPELGGMFADYFGINLKELPKDYEQALKLAQKRINTMLKNSPDVGIASIDIEKLMSRSEFDAWVSSLGKDASSELIKGISDVRSFLYKVRSDETKKQIQEWDKMLEKYAEYEFKRKQITEEYEKDMEIARKRGASQSVMDAITNRRDRRYAELDFNEFMRTPDWIVATGDLAGLTDNALGMLIERIEEYKRTASNLEPKQIKQINKALIALYKEQRKGNPFKLISTAMKEAKNRTVEYDEAINDTEREIQGLGEQIESAIEKGESTSELFSKLDSAKKRLEDLKKNQKEVGKLYFKYVVSGLQSIGAMAKTVGDEFASIFESLGDKGTAETIKGITGTLDKTLSLASAGSVFGPWGAAIGGALGLASSLFGIFAGKDSIQSAIEDSELAVKRLENAYKNLEFAIENAYGANVIGAKQAAIANKELQLVELERQLRLEKSRDSKHRDEERIETLKGEIIDLRNEIKTSYQEVATSLLGISSVGDAALEFMDAYISALRKGEDAQAAFTGSYKEMIASMIKQLWVTKVIGPQLESVIDELNNRLKNRSTAEAKAYEEASRKYTEMSNMSDAELVEQYFKSQGKDRNSAALSTFALIATGQLSSFSEALRKQAEKEMNDAKKELDKATTPTIGDMDLVAQGLDDIQPIIEAYNSQLDELLKRYDLYDTGDKESKLSALQQGISQISETTANALEAYMNGVSQQVYYHSSLLEQIRDSVVGLDLDVSLGVQSQMLLQLQNSYQTQQAIQQILEGVLVPSGRAFAVELLS